jgi:hypothetical protein
MINDVDDIKLASDWVKRVCLCRFLDIKDTTYREKEFMRKLFAHVSVSTTLVRGWLVATENPNLESGVGVFGLTRFKFNTFAFRTGNVFIAAHSTAAWVV